jgi:hypothetical protein
MGEAVVMSACVPQQQPNGYRNKKQLTKITNKLTFKL